MGGPGSGRRKGGVGGTRKGDIRRTQSYMGQTQKAQTLGKKKGSLTVKNAKRFRTEKNNLKRFGINKRVEK